MRRIFNFLVFRVWMVFHDRSSRWRNALFPAADSAAFNFWRSKISIFDSHQKLAWILTKMSSAADKQSSCSSWPDTCLTSTCCTLQPKFLWGLHLNSTKRIACAGRWVPHSFHFCTLLRGSKAQPFTSTRVLLLYRRDTKLTKDAADVPGR